MCIKLLKFLQKNNIFSNNQVAFRGGGGGAGSLTEHAILSIVDKIQRAIR